MQKKLIALAIAGLSSAAFAQSNVTIYGVANTVFENVAAGGASGAAANIRSRNRVSTNSSYIGFKGAESLGNGMTFVFQLETGVDTDSGAALFGTKRDTLIGVAGGFGTVAAGNVTGPYRAIGAATDFNPGGAGIGFQGLIGQLGGIKTTTDDRTGNVLAYISPKFSGFTAVVAYSANEAKTPTAATPAVDQDDPLWTVGLSYDNGPLYVAYAHVNAADKVTTGVTPATSAPATALAGVLVGAGLTGDKLKANRLAVKYNFGQGTTVAALWDSQKLDVALAAGGADVKRTAWALNAKHEFGTNAVYFQYARAKDLQGSAVGGTAADTGAKQMTLGFSHALSKRTLAQAYYTKLSNDNNVAYNFYNNGLTAAQLNAGADPRGFGVGLRHTF